MIVLDVQMPGMDGIETARLIKARDKTKDIPIIFISANSKDAEHLLQDTPQGQSTIWLNLLSLKS